MIKPWSNTLSADFKDIQITFISEKIKTDFNEEPFLKEALQLLIKEL